MNITKKRRGISGLMQVAMIVGIVIIFAGILFSFASDIFDVQTISGSVSMQKVFVHQVGSDTFVSVNIKNIGNTDITSLEAQVMVDTNSGTAGVQPFTVSILPSPLTPGITGSVYQKITDTSGASISLTTGQEIAIVINATAADGSMITEPTTVRIR